MTCPHGQASPTDCSKCVFGEAQWLPSEELEKIPLGQAHEERARAKLWIDRACLWKERAIAAETAAARSQAALAAAATPPPSPGKWCKLELRGSKDYWGYVDEVVEYRHTFCRLRVPDGNKPGWKMTKLVAGGAIFGELECTEEQARRMNLPKAEREAALALAAETETESASEAAPASPEPAEKET